MAKVPSGCARIQTGTPALTWAKMHRLQFGSDRHVRCSSGLLWAWLPSRCLLSQLTAVCRARGITSPSVLPGAAGHTSGHFAPALPCGAALSWLGPEKPTAWPWASSTWGHTRSGPWVATGESSVLPGKQQSYSYSAHSSRVGYRDWPGLRLSKTDMSPRSLELSFKNLNLQYTLSFPPALETKPSASVRHLTAQAAGKQSQQKCW